MGLPTILYEYVIQAPLPLWRLSHSLGATFADLVREVGAEAIVLVADRVMKKSIPRS